RRLIFRSMGAPRSSIRARRRREPESSRITTAVTPTWQKANTTARSKTTINRSNSILTTPGPSTTVAWRIRKRVNTTAPSKTLMTPSSSIPTTPTPNGAQTYVNKGDYERALLDFDEAIRLKPTLGAVWNGRCWARAIVGELQAALTDCYEALRLEPNAAVTLDSRGLTYLKMGQ